MHISVISLLFFAVVFGACQSRDQRQFLRDLEKKIRDELVAEEFYQFKDGCCNACSCCSTVQLMSTITNVCGIVAFENDSSFNFTLTISGERFLTVQIKGNYPPSQCKELKKGYKGCVTFSKVSINLKARKFSGCAELQINGKRVKIGCFQLPQITAHPKSRLLHFNMST